MKCSFQPSSWFSAVVLNIQPDDRMTEPTDYSTVGPNNQWGIAND